MPIVTIEWYEGRTDEQKREIAQGLTDLLVEVGKTQPDHVWIRFKDSKQSDWAMGGEIQSRPPAGGEPALGPPD
jgi:4-oxalocrotonate tautomerase